MPKLLWFAGVVKWTVSISDLPQHLAATVHLKIVSSFTDCFLSYGWVQLFTHRQPTMIMWVKITKLCLVALTGNGKDLKCIQTYWTPAENQDSCSWSASVLSWNPSCGHIHTLPQNVILRNKNVQNVSKHCILKIITVQPISFLCVVRFMESCIFWN